MKSEAMAVIGGDFIDYSALSWDEFADLRERFEGELEAEAQRAVDHQPTVVAHPAKGQRHHASESRDASEGDDDDASTSSGGNAEESSILVNEVRELRAAIADLAKAVLLLAEGQLKTPAPAPIAVPVEEAARRLGCGKRKVFYMLEKGKLAQAERVGRRRLILIESIERALVGALAKALNRRGGRPHGEPVDASKLVIP